MQNQETNKAIENLESADIIQLLQALPHRYPFLLIDRIINIKGDDSATGIKNVTINEPHFMGHFPDNPVMPGVLIVEAMAQTAGAISLLQRKETGKQSLVYFLTIDKAKFRKPVLPGDQLHIHVTKLKSRAALSKYACIAEVSGTRVAEAEVSAQIIFDAQA